MLGVFTYIHFVLHSVRFIVDYTAFLQTPIIRYMQSANYYNHMVIMVIMQTYWVSVVIYTIVIFRTLCSQAISKKTLELELVHKRWGPKGTVQVSASHTTTTKVRGIAIVHCSIQLLLLCTCTGTLYITLCTLCFVHTLLIGE